jgi:cytochrome c-type biogenesis protein CcmH/NrfG
MLLERAVRIEPREALLWIRLSRAHLAQGEMRAAFQHARKAIALAGSDSSKFSAAWLQLANVFTAQGKNAEAQQIRRRFSRSSG